jgi:hypothetical protein
VPEDAPTADFVGVGRYSGSTMAGSFCPTDDQPATAGSGAGRLWLTGIVVGDAGAFDAELAGEPGLLISANPIIADLTADPGNYAPAIGEISVVVPLEGGTNTATLEHPRDLGHCGFDGVSTTTATAVRGDAPD